MKAAGCLCAAALLCGPALAGEAVPGFAGKPRVEKQGGKYVITFAPRRACDAAVSIVGPDGRTVRHLAAGVLGPNAPAPFQRNALAQRLEWDGKDDRGAPAPAGCSVRVGLGLRATLDKPLGWDPLTLPPVVGLGCGPDGTLYALCGTRWSSTLVALSREGKYLRTILPWPATLPPGKLRGLRIFTAPDGARLPVFEQRCGGVIPQQRNMPMQTLAVSPDGKVGCLGNGRSEAKGEKTLDLIVLGTDGSVAERSFYGPKLLAVRWPAKIRGTPYLAAAPDGKTVYASIGGKLYKSGWSGEDPAEPFAHKAVRAAAGVAVDGKGEVYAADNKGGKILVLKPDGSKSREIACPAPGFIAVHPKSGDVYVLTAERKKKLVKLSADGAVRCTLALPKTGIIKGGDGEGERWASFALDASAEPPVLWVGNPVLSVRAGEKRLPLWRVEDKGAAFGEPEPVGTLAGEPEFLAVDRARDEVYVRHHLTIRRYQGATAEASLFVPKVKSKVRWLKAFRTNDFDIGPDGHVYVVGQVPPEIVRLDRDGRPVPFPGGAESIRVEKYIWHGGWGNGGLDVAPDGDIFVASYTPDKKGAAVHCFGPDGKPKKENLVTRLPRAAFGVRGGRDGSVYVGTAWKPGAAEAPLYAGILNAIAKGGALDHARFFRPDRPREYSPVYRMDLGMIARFPAGGGPLGAETWRRAGFSPLPAKRHLALTLYGCTCQNGRFDLDGFDRIYSPDALTCGVNVLDSAGNPILRIGRYGNRDDLAAATGAEDSKVPFWYPVYVAAGDGALYVSDTATMCVLRVILSCRAQEEAPVP